MDLAKLIFRSTGASKMNYGLRPYELRLRRMNYASGM